MSKVSGIDKIVNRILSLPTWVKQYVYIELRKDLRKFADLKNLDAKNGEDMIQLYVPTPTAYGHAAIRGKSTLPYSLNLNNVTEDQLSFLRSTGINRRVIDICNEQQWSLMKCSKVFLSCIEGNLVEPIENTSVSNVLYFLAGKIRLGEYLLRMNKISLNQIDRALYTQKQIADQVGEKTKIGDLLVNLGYIEEVDKDEILSLKENSNYTLCMEDENAKMSTFISKLQNALNITKQENKALQEDLMYFQEEIHAKNEALALTQMEVAKLKEEIEGLKVKKNAIKSWFFNDTLKRA